MTDLVRAALLLPALSLVLSGAALVGTRARASGVLLVVAGVGVAASVALGLSGHQRAAAYVLTGALALATALAAITYPQLSWPHPVEFCALVLVVAAGVFATARASSSAVVGPMAIALGLAVMARAWWRYETGDDDDRLALLWLGLLWVSAGIVFGHATFLLDEVSAGLVGAVVFGAVPPAMVVGVRRPRIVDVRGVIVQVAVFGVAVIAYIAIFVGVVATLDWVGIDTPSVGVLAVIGALAATSFHPLRVALRGVIDELLFGDRPDPLDAATRVADRIGDDPVLALRAIREALVLPYASLLVDGVTLATSGTAVTHTRTLPLSLGGDTVGEMVVGLRSGDLALSAGDEHVLRIVAPLLAQTLRARALAADLQESRGHAIAAIEEERRRLRRDLHDGLGPTLSGIAFTADAARNSLGSPDEADQLLRGLRSDAVTAIGEIRRLVYGMRPPALDELGLVPALRQRALQLRTSDGHPLLVDVDAPGDLPPLPAAVEVAAYRIALEALTNTARHSGSDRAAVRLGISAGSLTVEVSDSGHSPRAWRAGVGLSSMRERAAEVGGTVTARGGPDGG
ncbi:MAG: hypothetical protein JWO46_364, partial [Nocardioidaceae bacterium]|nr:hypothetical protein [Nocardioidaceae bacterium]